MSTWKVFKEKIKLFLHANADSLVIGKVGEFQVVEKKGIYKDGDEVVFAPEKSILSGAIKDEFSRYLVGKDGNRIGPMRLRGEDSMGIIIPTYLLPDLTQYEIGEDISSILDITRYEPPIPEGFKGILKRVTDVKLNNHDCGRIGIYLDEFVEGERIVITEKVHGTQLAVVYNSDTGELYLSSKDAFRAGLHIEEDGENTYWRALRNDNIHELLRVTYKDVGNVQLFGEVIPAFKKYKYGFTKDKPTVKLFDIQVGGTSIPYDRIPDVFKALWTPLLYDGPLHLNEARTSLAPEITALVNQKEKVSGQEIHWAEGGVLRPYIDRKAKDNHWLKLKMISKNYKETGEEFS